jgi:hypothetical protein
VAKSKMTNIDSVFRLAKKTHYYSPKKAKTLSAILPGLGHLYIKDYKNAANSFVLNTGLLSLSIYTTVNYGWFEGLVLILPWWQKYYVGGFERAAILAKKRNEQQRNRFMEQIYISVNEF